jgi:hypothetical protein
MLRFDVSLCRSYAEHSDDGNMLCCGPVNCGQGLYSSSSQSRCQPECAAHHSERKHSGAAKSLLTLSPGFPPFPFQHSTQPSQGPLSLCKPFACTRSIPRSLRMRCSISSIASSAFCPHPSGSGAIMIIMTSAPLQRSSYRRPGARRQSYRVTGPSKPRRIVRSRTRDTKVRLCGCQWQGRVGRLGRSASTPPFSRCYPFTTYAIHTQ